MAEKVEKRVKISSDGVHLDELVWETVVMKNGVPYRQVWLFERQYFPCGRCRSTQVKFMSLPTGVYKSCPKCGFAEGVATTNIDTGDRYAELIDEKIVSIAEAWEILRKHGAHLYAPQDLPPKPTERSSRKIVIDE